jgi:hypothetical protein
LVVATPRARRAAAYHEAGHVVIALLLGAGVDFASIAEADAKVPERPGVSRYDFAPRFAGREDTPVLRAERMEAETVTLLAGPRAPILARCEGNYLEKTVQEHRLDAIREILEVWGPDDFAWEDMHAYLDEMDARASEMLRTHWSAVEVVAEALLDRARLDGVAIGQIAGIGQP